MLFSYYYGSPEAHTDEGRSLKKTFQTKQNIHWQNFRFPFFLSLFHLFSFHWWWKRRAKIFSCILFYKSTRRFITLQHIFDILLTFTQLYANATLLLRKQIFPTNVVDFKFYFISTSLLLLSTPTFTLSVSCYLSRALVTRVAVHR